MCAMELPSLPSADMNRLLSTFKFSAPGVISIENHSDAETDSPEPRTPKFGQFSSYFPERALLTRNTNPVLSKSPLPSWSTSAGIPSLDLKSSGDNLLSGLPSFVLEQFFDMPEVRKQQKEAETTDMNIPTTVLESLEHLSNSKIVEKIPEKVASPKPETKPAGKNLPEVMVVGEDGKTTSFVKFLNEPIEIPQELIEWTVLGNNVSVLPRELPVTRDDSGPSEIQERGPEDTTKSPRMTCQEALMPRSSVPEMTRDVSFSDLMKGSIVVADGDLSYEVTVIVPEEHEPMDVAAYTCVEDEVTQNPIQLAGSAEGVAVVSNVRRETLSVQSEGQCYPPQGLFIEISSDDSSQMNSSSNLAPRLPHPGLASEFSTDESFDSSDSRVYAELTTVQPSSTGINSAVDHLTSFRDQTHSREPPASPSVIETVGEVPGASCSSESSESSSLKDKIKADIRAKIQKVRQEQGKAPIKVSFEERPLGELTEEEKEKIMTRKLKNRESAVRSRKKTQSRLQFLEKEVKELERENHRLKNENSHIKQEVTNLCNMQQGLKVRKPALKRQCSSSKAQAKSLHEAIEALLALEGAT